MISHVNLIHIFGSGPLLIYVGAVKPENKWIYKSLLVLGLLIAAAFVWKIISTDVSQRHVWFFIHAAIFAPLLIYVGLYEHKTEQIVFSLLLAIGFAALGYHVFRAASKLSTSK